MQCTAKSKRSKQQCKRAAMEGKEVCLMHGGKSLSGAGSPRAKTLRHSKLLPKRLRKLLEDAQQQGNPVDLTDEIYLLDTRISDLFRSMNNDNIEEKLATIEKAFNEFEAAFHSDDKDKLAHAKIELAKAIHVGVQESQTWDRIMRLFDLRRKLVSVQDRKQARAESSIGASVLMDYTMRLIHIYREAVSNNCAAQGETLITNIRVALLEGKFTTDVTDSVLGMLVPEIQKAYARTQRFILSDTSRGIAALLPPETLPNAES
ncbi:MAG: HGGxSTG domain-containing protein [Blastocatellia bacterium]